jgi:hypothetical protein
LWRGKVEKVDEFLLYAPAKIATNLLGLKVTEVREIPNLEILHGQKRSVEVVGMLNRQQKTIAVAQKYGFEQGRFTLAHEIAHFILHPGTILHRERPLNFTLDRARRPRNERDADFFGAELLMPAKLVREHFLARFDGIVDGRRRDHALFYWLSCQNPMLNEEKLFAEDPLFRAIQVANTRYCFGKRIISMCEFFHVSATAMAIQLIDLGLVK